MQSRTMAFVDSLLEHKSAFLAAIRTRYSFEDDSVERFEEITNTVIVTETDAEMRKYIETKLGAMTKEHLADLLNEYGLVKKGNKDVLIARIVNAKMGI
jgi:hypothetical protein